MQGLEDNSHSTLRLVECYKSNGVKVRKWESDLCVHNEVMFELEGSDRQGNFSGTRSVNCVDARGGYRVLHVDVMKL